MDINKYFDGIEKFIDNLSDEQFDALMIECGIEKCPYIEDYGRTERFCFKSDSLMAKTNTIKRIVYVNNMDYSNFFDTTDKRAA